MGVDNIRDMLNDLEEERDQYREDAIEQRQEAQSWRDEAELLENQRDGYCERAERLEELVNALIDNLNGDLVKVWQDHRAILSEIGY